MTFNPHHPAQTDTAALFQYYKTMYDASQHPHAGPSMPVAGPSTGGPSTSAPAPAPASTSTSAPPAPAHAESASAQAPRRTRKLSPAALAMVREWYAAHPEHSPDDRRELVRQVVKLYPEDSWYTYQRLTAWVGNRRQAERRQSEKKKSTAEILWPSLTKDIIENLRILREQRPSTVPLPASIEIWAKRLRVPVSEIEAWNTYNPENDKETVASPREQKPTLHLPTPEATASPEPSYPVVAQSPTTPSTPMQISPIQLPTNAQTIVKQQPYSPVQPHFVPLVAQPPPPAVPPPQPVAYIQQWNALPPQYHPPDIRQYQTPQPQLEIKQFQPPVLAPFAQPTAQPQPAPPIEATMPAPAPVITTPAPSLQDKLLGSLVATTKELDLTVPPPVEVTSLSDFDAKFAPFEAMMRGLLQRAAAGGYAPLDLPMDLQQLELPEVAEPEEYAIDIDPIQRV